MFKNCTLIASVLVLLSACANNTETHNHNAAGTAQSADAEPGSVVSNTIDLYAGDDMKFSQKFFTVAAGKPVHLTFTHNGTMNKDIMGHNFVLLKPGSIVNDFANEAVNAKETDYIPASAADKVVVKTKLLGGGETDHIEFTLTEKGDYPFLCSFPGHGGIMKGVITVQ